MTVWKKHDESDTMPTAFDSLIEVETWAAKGSFIELASNLDWKYVKFYRVVQAKK